MRVGATRAILGTLLTLNTLERAPKEAETMISQFEISKYHDFISSNYYARMH